MKIEIEKPFVPQFVADWIEQLYGQGFNSDDLLEALFSRNYEVAELKIFEWFTDDKERAIIAVLYGYEVDREPRYYAKIKGWELIHIEAVKAYWCLDIDDLFISTNGDLDIGEDHTKMTKTEWNEIGINDSNADFEKVEE